MAFEKLTDKQKKMFVSYISPFLTTNAGISDHRARLMKIDHLVERSYTSNKKEGCRDGSSKEKEAPEEDNITIPVVGPQLSTIAAQLAKIFLRNDPPLQMFSAPAGADIANQYNILYGRYSRKFKWRRNLLCAIRDVVTYNFCAAEVRWRSRAVGVVSSSVSVQTGRMKTTGAFEEGEEIRHLNPYNVVWDGSVPIEEVAYRGAYAGYFTKYTRIGLFQYLRDIGLEVTPALYKEITSASGELENLFFTPKINDVSANDDSPQTYDGMWDGEEAEKEVKTGTDKYILTTLYLRIIPLDFGITSDTSADITIIKLYLLGTSVLLGAEIMDNAHQLFPIVFGQGEESALGSNSYTLSEELAPLQNTATKLYHTELASSRRLISDRAIYDANMIDPKEVNNPSPTAKIPLRRSMSGSTTLQQAYYAIPYEDRALGVRIQQANNILGFASPISGTNSAMQGQFVRGNKSAQEFNSIMSSAGDRLLQSAIFFDDQFFSPLRTILLSDTLQYQNNIKVFDKDSGQFIEVDMTKLRDNPLDFDIAAGLIPADQLASADFLTQLLQVIGSRQDLAGEFKTMDALCYIAETQGVKYLKRFLKTDEEKQQEQQQQIEQAQRMLQLQQQAKNQESQNSQDPQTQQPPIQ